MSREPSLTLDQAAMMYRNSEITQQDLRQFQKQRIEEEEVGYTRRHRQIDTSHEEIRQMIQTEKETIKKEKISEQAETRKHLADTARERENISPQKIPQHVEKHVESEKRITTLRRFGKKKQQLNGTN